MMNFRLLYWGSSILTGPCNGSWRDTDKRQFDEFDSRRSPVDKTQSDFHHVHSNWVGIRFDPGYHTISGTSVKLVFPDRARLTTVTLWCKNAVLSGDFSRTDENPKDWFSIPTGNELINHIGFTSDMQVGIVRRVELNIPSYGNAQWRVERRFFPNWDRYHFWYSPYTQWKTLNTRDAQIAMSLVTQECLSWTPDDEWEFYSRLTSVMQWTGAANNVGIFDLDMTGSIVAPEHHTTAVLPREDRLEYGELSLEAVQAVRLVNTDPYMVAQDVIEFKRLRSMIPKSKKDFSNPKYWANLYLAMKFGVEQSVRDGKGIYEDARRYRLRSAIGCSNIYSTRNSTIKAAAGTAFIRRCCHICYFVGDDPITRAIRKLYDYNLMPTVSLAWELIPFSFVVDWFTNVDTLISEIDYAPMYATLAVRYASYSNHEAITAKVPKCAGVVTPAYGTTVRFDRQIVPEAIEPIPRFKVSLPSGNNIVTGSALFIQRA